MAEMSAEQQKELQEKLSKMSPEELREFQKQQCIFCQIIDGAIPSRIVYKDAKVTALLDINPAAAGHLLILPNEHYAVMPQMPEEEVNHLFTVVKQLSQTLIKSLGVEGTSIFAANGSAAGQRANHFMVHLIPREQGDGLPLTMDLKQIGGKQFEQMKAQLAPAVAQMLGGKKEVKEEKEESKKEQKEPEQKEEKPEEGGSDLDKIAELLK